MASIEHIVAQRQDLLNTQVQASDATAIASNPARGGFFIQNQGTNVLFVKFGSGASTSSYQIALKGGSGNDDGQGGSFSMMEGVVYTGIITIAGTSPRYNAFEI